MISDKLVQNIKVSGTNQSINLDKLSATKEYFGPISKESKPLPKTDIPGFRSVTTTTGPSVESVIYNNPSTNINRILLPQGVNLANSSLRSLQPYAGALAYDIAANAGAGETYVGSSDGTTWLPIGTSGATGITSVNDSTNPGKTLVQNPGSGPGIMIKTLVDGPGISSINNVDNVVINNTGVLSVLNSAGPGSTLVDITDLQNPLVRRVIAGTGISTSVASSSLTVTNTGVLTVASTAGPGSSMVASGVAPTPTIKKLFSSDSSVGITDNGTYLDLVTVDQPAIPNYRDVTSSGISLTYQPGGVTNTSPQTTPLQLKTLIAGSGVTIDNSAPYSSLTISSTSSPITDVENTSASGGFTNLVDNPGGNPVYVRQFTSGNGSINVTLQNAPGNTSYIDLTSNFSVTSTGGAGVGLVNTGGPPTASIKTLYSSNGSITLTDNGTYIDMVDSGPGSNVQNTGSGVPLVAMTGTGMVTVKGLTSNSSTITITDNGSSVDLEVAGGGGATSVQNATGATTGVRTLVVNPGGNPVYIEALSGDGYSNGGVTVTDISSSQVQLDCTISGIGSGTSLPSSATLIYPNSTRGGPFPTFSQIKTIAITNNNIGQGFMGLAITDDGSSSGNVVINFSLT